MFCGRGIFGFRAGGVIDFGRCRRKCFVCTLFKKLPVIHIFRLPTTGEKQFLVFFLFGLKWCLLHIFVLEFQKGANYTHFFRISKRCQLYTFLEFNFFQKNEKKKTILRGQ
jgi:hypothetical protein